ncbi:MAG: hypothetical protein H6657_25250 [Ardenticatenaceae bacterium]|nr:hypothetical protein [Ardenticatenaceae bacterium]
MKQPTQINSLPELQRLMPRLLKDAADQPSLLLAAAANPLLAMARMGYEVAPEAARTIEYRARFGEAGGAAFEQLQAELFQTAGQTFDPADGRILRRVLAELLPTEATQKGQKGQNVERKQRTALLDAAESRPIGVPGQQPLRDPLADYADLHPIIPLLVEWRRQNLQSPRFASEEVFDRILAGEQKLPITEVTFTLQPRSRRKAGTA